MENYTVNQPGSAAAKFPTSLERGDKMIINNTRTGPQGSKLYWSVPHSGVYRIEAWGAKGGGSGNYGGFGARMRGDFELKVGEIIILLAGQQGGVGNAIYNEGGGGGGSFVVKSGNIPLLIAGGGGGVTQYGGPVWPGYGGEDTNLGSSVPNGLGSRGKGEGGYGGKTDSDGNGGGGFNSSGVSKKYGTGGESFLLSAYGGTGYSNNSGIGGFGCGGGSAFTSGGGGGGYTGGNGGSSPIPAAGGGSYNIGANQDNARAVNSGHGRIEITFIGSANEPPTKPSLIRQPVSNNINLSSEAITLEWTASTDPEGNPVTYEIDFYNGTTWVSIATKITTTKYDCILPSVATDKAQLRIRATDSENGASEYSLSNVFTVAKQLYVIKEGEMKKTYKNGNWESI